MGLTRRIRGAVLFWLWILAAVVLVWGRGPLQGGRDRHPYDAFLRGRLNQQQIADVIAYIASLPSVPETSDLVRRRPTTARTAKR